jgi:predicted nucleic acid-binding protein
VTLVVDASVVVAALIDRQRFGSWADSLLEREPLLAPHLLPAEFTSLLRRAVRLGVVTADFASLIQEEFAELPIDLFPYAPFASRIWELRENLTPYDAWYVALAEALESPLATADLRLSRAPGPRCEFLVPSE